MILSLVLLMASLTGSHPVHISYTNVEIRKGEKTISVLHKVSCDEFKLLYLHLNDRELKVNTEEDFEESQILWLENYFNSAFILSTDMETYHVKLMQKNQDSDNFWLYFEARIVDNSFESLQIDNKLYLELFEDQQNMITLVCGTHQQGELFTNYDRSKRLIFSCE
jgi:hypothetical protein